MKAHLLFRDRDFDWQWALQAAEEREVRRSGRRHRMRKPVRPSPLPWNGDALVQDLELETLIGAMGRGDDFVSEVARTVLLTSPQNDIGTIRYRQDVLRDCLDHPDVVRDLYALAGGAMEEERKHYLGTLNHYPDWVLRWATELIAGLLGTIKKLKRAADSHAGEFVSEGWAALFATVRNELSDDYLASVDHHLAQLKFKNGVLLSARLGSGNRGTGYVLHRPPRKGRLLERLFTRQQPTYSFSLAPRDESGARALRDLENRGIGIAASALGQSADHVRNFFNMLRAELAFYVGCVNLHETLAGKGEPTCFPSPEAAGEPRLSADGLYDVCLALNVRQRVVGNAVDADGRDLVIVTGANQGGKSTFLRSVGLAQLMMQAGMFVAAGAFRSSVRDSLLTHFRREEDAGMKSGKLDEEMARMSAIVDHVTAHPMILFNESFAATNEREGSEIARQILSALLERQVTTIFVTHLYELARGFHERKEENVLFLRADRQADGTRTFKLGEGEPLPTSFGEDLYKGIFDGGNGCRDAAMSAAGAAGR